MLALMVIILIVINFIKYYIVCKSLLLGINIMFIPKPMTIFMTSLSPWIFQ